MIRRFLWLIFGYFYRLIVKPLVFLMTPDKAHSSTLDFANKVGEWRWMRWLVAFIFKNKKNDRLSQNIFGLDFENPIGLSAGFDKNAEAINVTSNLGFGFGEVGSVTANKCEGNEKPWFYRLPLHKSMVVNVGLANVGSEAVLKKLDSNSNINSRYNVILSVAKTNTREVVTVEKGIEDYVASAKRANKSNIVRMIELNISCPNTFGGEPFTNSKDLEKLLTAIDKLKLKKPVVIKMPVDINWTKTEKLLDVIVGHKIEGVTIANLAKDRTILDLGDELPDSVAGNLSGKPTFELSNQLIKQTYVNYGDRLKIIGVGGVFSAEDAYLKIKLGASLVEFISAFIYQGPQLASEINYDLIKMLKNDGFDNISQAVGASSLKKVEKTNDRN